MEMYESIFQNHIKKEEFKSFPQTVNGPLNPPPFSLATLDKRSIIRKQVMTSQVYAGTSTKDNPSLSHVFADNSSIISAEDTEIAALLTSLKKSDSKFR